MLFLALGNIAVLISDGEELVPTDFHVLYMRSFFNLERIYCQYEMLIYKQG